jgi:ATP-binding cassette subfamily B protein
MATRTRHVLASLFSADAPLFRPFERLIDPFLEASSAPPRGSGAFLRWAVRPARGPLLALAVVSILVGAVEAAVFWMIGGLVDRASTHGPEGFFAAEWRWLAGLTILLVVVRPAVTLCQNALGSLSIGPGLNPMTIWRLHRHTLGQAMRFFEEDFSGRIAQKQMQTANAMTQASMETLNAIGMMVAYVVAMTVLLATADWRLAAVSVLWAIGYVVALRWVLPIVRERARLRAEARAGVTGRLVDSITHIKTVKLFAHGAREEATAREALGRYRSAALGFGRPLMTMRFILALLNTLFMLAILGTGLALWSSGAATIGVLAMAVMLTLRATAMSNWIAFTAMSIFGELGAVEDGAKTLSPPHDIVDRLNAITPSRVEGRVAFEGVVYRYGKPTGGVDGLQFELAPGEKVGLAGRSGAGKSTAVSLLLRLYDVEQGRVTLDGVDIRDLSQDALRRAVSVVTQDVAVFNRSALDNILYGNPEADRGAAVDAAKRARAHDFIETLSDGRGRKGYDAHLGERGVKLSGGQRQRIALARAILKDAPVLVLDEATSALDSEVEAEIQGALTDVMRGKTVLAIAHRLSTIAMMDRIIVMDGGRVVEQGRHAELLRRGGIYADLWHRQSGGFFGVEAAE